MLQNLRERGLAGDFARLPSRYHHRMHRVLLVLVAVCAMSCGHTKANGTDGSPSPGSDGNLPADGPATGCPYASAISAPGIYRLDVQSLFANGGAVDWGALHQALACASTALGSGAGNGVRVIVQLPAGQIDLSQTVVDDQGQPLKGSIDVSGFNCVDPSAPNCGDVGGQPANTTNELIVQGAGAQSTSIVFALDSADHSRDVTGIYARAATNVTFRDMSFTWPYLTVSQGVVVSSTTTAAVLDIEPGFPGPDKILDTVNFPSSGRYLKLYAHYTVPGDPVTYCKIVEDPLNPDGSINYSQVAWSPGVAQPDPSGHPNRWTIPFSNPQPSPPFSAGQLVTIKSKEGRNVYQFLACSNITFDRVAWLRRSRGVFGGATMNGTSYGTQNVTVRDSTIVPEAAIGGIMPCLATPDGGPQVGGQLGFPSSGHVFTGNRFYFTGDDSIAFFDATNSTVTGNNILGSQSGRGIMFDFTDPNVLVSNGAAGFVYCNPPNNLAYNYLYQIIGTPPMGSATALTNCQ